MRAWLVSPALAAVVDDVTPPAAATTSGMATLATILGGLALVGLCGILALIVWPLTVERSIDDSDDKDAGVRRLPRRDQSDPSGDQRRAA